VQTVRYFLGVFLSLARRFGFTATGISDCRVQAGSVAQGRKSGIATHSGQCSTATGHNLVSTSGELQIALQNF
jgi:hypothetical protein